MAIAGETPGNSDREKIGKVLAMIDACKKKPKLVLEIEKILR